MESSTLGLLVGLKGLVIFAAFVSVIYFAGLLYRRRVDGSVLLLSGGISILVGYAVGLTFFTFGYLSLLASLAFESIGAGVAAYGFSRIARATINNRTRT